MLRPPRDHRGNNHRLPHVLHLLQGSTCLWRRIRSIVISLGVGLVFSVVVGLVGARPARAQDGASPAEPAVPEKAGKALRAFRITGGSPQIDGRLDEEVWAAADAIDDLVQDEPTPRAG